MSTTLTTPISTKIIVGVLSTSVALSGVVALSRQNILSERLASTSPYAIAALPQPVANTAVLGASTSPTYATNVIRVVQQKATAITLPGAKHITVTMSVINHDSKPLQLPFYGQALLVDSSRNIFQPTASYQAGKILGGPLAPGASQTYVLDYDIPLTSALWEFIFQAKTEDQPIVTKLTT